MNKSKSFCEPHDADLMVLIKMVEERPCLWDKSSLKAPGERKQAWREISRHFAPVDFDDMDPAEQSKLEDNLRSKWKNMRDTFVKSMRTNLKQPYKYHEVLKFLLRCPILSKQLSYSVEKTQNDKVRAGKRLKSMYFSFSNKLARKKLAKKNLRKRKTKKIVTNPPVSQQKDIIQASFLPKTIVNNVNSTIELRKNDIPDEDKAFFISIMPTVKKLTDDEKLEFRMGVLSTIREINCRLKVNQSAIMPNAECSGLLFVCDDEFSEVKDENSVSN